MIQERSIRRALMCACVALSISMIGVRAQKPAQKPADNPSLIEIKADAENSTVRFGDELKIRLTLYNRSALPLAIASTSLRLKHEGWSVWWGGGSGRGDEISLLVEGYSKPHIVIPPGESVTFSCRDRDVAVTALGRIKAHYSVSADDEALSKLFAEVKISVEFDTAPSEFMTSVWAARTDEERERLQPRFRDLLMMRASDKDGRDADFVAGTFTYLAGYALPLLEKAFQDKDAVVREQAVSALDYSVWAVGNLNSFLEDFDKAGDRPTWAAGLAKMGKDSAREVFIRISLEALRDEDVRVRVAAVEALTQKETKEALDAIKSLTGDPDAKVRSAAQKYLSKLAGESGAMESIAASLADPDEGVRNAALTALERSPEPPPLAILERAFRSAKGEAALRLIHLLFEQEYVDFPATLLANFNKRTEAERLDIMTLIAGHTDIGSMDLIALGLRDPSLEVQRAAMMRLLAFPREKAIALLSSYSRKAPLRELEQAVRSEIESRRLWPFLSGELGLQAMASETVFPSRNGTVPMVSPDGQWIAYVETGWGRPGGSGGMGRSNLLSLVHVVRRDGSEDRLVSDMFLAGWMPDSKRIASARDGYAAICDLEGNIVTEFGSPLDKRYLSQRGDWRSDPRHQWGDRMPKSKRLPEVDNFEFGEDGAFSPDGKWFGPLFGNGIAHFIDSNGRTIKVKLPGDFNSRGQRASWSPDGKHVVLMRLGDEGG
ncbi:MAG: HEAT repeat domain-containing protein, partial [Acidobacteriota bacterium]